MKFDTLLQDGIDGSLSSRRVVTFSAFVFCSIAFFANLFFDRKIDPVIFEGMMYIAIAGLGATVAEKFSSRNNKQYVYEPKRPMYGTPLPKVEEREI
ncbi:MAG: hypothetical protein EBR30_04030 [Cytophagia bacterium]|jgi:hypothetical protein|nr:hypothetical protein [Cytophagia bacterium]